MYTLQRCVDQAQYHPAHKRVLLCCRAAQQPAHKPEHWPGQAPVQEWRLRGPRRALRWVTLCCGACPGLPCRKLACNRPEVFRCRAGCSSRNVPRALSFRFAAANNTFWNVYASSPSQLLPLPACDFGPSQTFVGGAYAPPEDGSGDRDNSDRRRLLKASGPAATSRPSWCAAQGWWVEVVQRGNKVQPADLHAAMVQRRLSHR